MMSGLRIAAILIAFGLSVASPGHADDTSDCLDAHVRAQVERRDGKLRSARAALALCARSACPAKVQKDCAEWLVEIEKLVPSVTVKARDVSGTETADVEVVIDGTSVSKHLDGRPIDLDPGEHTFRFVDRSGKRIEQRVVMREGEQRRELSVDFAPPKKPPPPPAASTPPFSPPPLAYVFGGASLVALGSFGYFAVTGRQKQDELERCAPDCDLDEVHGMRRRYLAADISLGVAAATAGIAVYLTLSESSRGARVGLRRVDNRNLLSLGARF